MEPKNKDLPENDHKAFRPRHKKLASILAAAMLVVGIGTFALSKQESNLIPRTSMVDKKLEYCKYFKNEGVNNEGREYFESNYNEMVDSMVINMRNQFHLEDKIKTELHQLIREKPDNNYFSDEAEIIDFFVYMGLVCLGMYGIVNLLNEDSNRGEHLATKYESRDKGKLTTLNGSLLKKEFYKPMKVELVFETYSYLTGRLDDLYLLMETEEGQRRVRFCYKRGADPDTAKRLNDTLKLGDIVKIYALKNDLGGPYFGIEGIKN